VRPPPRRAPPRGGLHPAAGPAQASRGLADSRPPGSGRSPMGGESSRFPAPWREPFKDNDRETATAGELWLGAGRPRRKAPRGVRLRGGALGPIPSEQSKASGQGKAFSRNTCSQLRARRPSGTMGNAPPRSKARPTLFREPRKKGTVLASRPRRPRTRRTASTRVGIGPLEKNLWGRGTVFAGDRPSRSCPRHDQPGRDGTGEGALLRRRTDGPLAGPAGKIFPGSGELVACRVVSIGAGDPRSPKTTNHPRARGPARHEHRRPTGGTMGMRA